MYPFTEHTRAIVDVVRRLVDDHQMPLERRVLRGETLTRADREPGIRAARAVGLWGLTAPAEHGGAALSMVDKCAIAEVNHRCLVPIRFGGNALPPMYALAGEQKRRYLDPVLDGTLHLCFAQTEPGGGGDPAGAISTHAKRTERGWVINGSKIWISSFADADLVFVLARTEQGNRTGGISMFAVAKDNPGMIAREVPMLGTFKTHQLTFADCEVDELALIGLEGSGFKSAQYTLSLARVDVAARALAISARCIEMMIAHAKERKVFGQVLSELQETQSKIVDSWVELQQNRLLVYATAEKIDRGEDARVEAGMVKMTCTEMCGRIIDRAIQLHGAAGCTYEHPLAHWYDHQRMSRIYEGPTEVHKYRVIARRLMQ
ncbi:MAG: acyl-CoA dehydrogenase family protein [Burkholderiaceae bacterium]